MRFYFGVGAPRKVSSLHVIGEVTFKAPVIACDAGVSRYWEMLH